ncbi:MAG: hypothetical protein IJ537_08740 [Bacteroidaceae bacterium]|nr:hypothetical protein [Bacteroidaceae bacterium]
MKYIAPSIKIEEAQAAQMLAESLNIVGDKTVDGNKALVKEDNAWDIWCESSTSFPNQSIDRITRTPRCTNVRRGFFSLPEGKPHTLS